MKKNIFIAGSIVLVALLVFVGYLFSQKTYKIATTPAENKFTEEIDSSIYYVPENDGLKTDSSFYATPKFLYKDGEFSYYIYPRETEGLSPIARESTISKEFTGLSTGWHYAFTPDKHWMVFADYRSDNKEGLCTVRISPPITKCIGLVSPDETFVRSEGDMGEPLIKIKWLNESTFEINVYKRATKEQVVSGVYELTEVIRTQKINLK